jgi:lysophospholipase L1-like esterase
VVTPANGFKWGYIPYTGDVIGSWSGWFTAPIVIPAGKTFIVQIARVTEVTSETADVATFLSKITFTTKDTRRIEALEHDNVLLSASIDDIQTGNVTPEYLYTFADFVEDVPTWTSYNASYFTVTDNAVSISANYVFTYKRNFFLYKPSTNITVKFKIAVNGYAGGTNAQQLRITASGYTGSNVQKDISVSADGQTVTYDSNTYAIDDDIDVVLTLENVSENASAYVGLNNRNNASMSPIAYTIKDFEVYYTPTKTRTVAMYANQVVGKRYNGKTWGAIGDSLTAPYYNLYVDYVADALGLTATNYGVGSSDVTYDADETVPSFVARVCGTHGQDGYNDEFDLWTVFGGINDAVSGATIGTITDSVETTFYGAMNLIIQHLLALPNHPTVALIAPYDCANTSEANYITAVKNIGKKYGLPVLDLSEVSGINSETWSYYLRDSIHPNQHGANKLRPIILEWFERLRLEETTPDMPH